MKGRSLKIVVAAMFLSGILVSSSMATDWLTATVARTMNSNNGVTALMLTYVKDGNPCTWDKASAGCDSCWFTAAGDGQDDQALAVALTAISLGVDVRVGVEQCPSSSDPDGTFSTIGLDVK